MDVNVVNSQFLFSYFVQSERSFHAHGRIHSKIRNKLKTDRAAKITFVAFNLAVVGRKPPKKKPTEETSSSQKSQTETSNISSSDDEDEDTYSGSDDDSDDEIEI
jgi:hypothetical protein